MPQLYENLNWSFLEESDQQEEGDSLNWTFLEGDTTDDDGLNWSFLREPNKKKLPTFQQAETSPYASLPRRFFDRFAEGFAPFGLYESEIGKPENLSEILTDVAGGLTGFAAGFIPVALMTGGVSVPLRAVTALGKIKDVTKLRKALTLVAKAQKATTEGERTGHALRASKLLGFETVEEFTEKGLPAIASAIPKSSGILAKVPGYTNFILKASINSPKMARAFNAGISNIVSFGIHGQMHVPIRTSVEDRLKQMTSDTAMGIAFTVAGLPSTLGVKGPWKYAEDIMLFGVGAGSDLGKSNMTMTERVAHGLGLLAFHHGMRGLRKIGIEEKQIQALRDMGWTYEDAYLIVKSAKNVNDAVAKHVDSVSKNIKGRIFHNINSADPESKGKIAVEVTPGFITKTKDGKFQLRGRYIENQNNPDRVGEDFIIEGKSREDVRRQFVSSKRRRDGSGGHGFVMPITKAKADIVYDIPSVSDEDIKKSKEYKKVGTSIDKIRKNYDTRLGERGYEIDPKTGTIRLYVIKGGKKAYIDKKTAQNILSEPAQMGEVPDPMARAQAMEKVENIWMHDEGLLYQSELYKDASLKHMTVEQAAWRNAYTLAKRVVNTEGIEDKELKLIIGDFMPDVIPRGKLLNKGISSYDAADLKYMTRKELDAFVTMFSPDTGRKFLDNTVVRVPPDRFYDAKVKVRKSLTRWKQLFRRQALPFYTELRLLGAKGAAKVSMDFELLRQQIAGEGTQLYKHLRHMGVKDKHIKLISGEIDPIYIDGFRGELAKHGYDVPKIIKIIKDHNDYNYAYLVASGNEVKVFKKKKMGFGWSPIFELRDKDNNIIELATPKGNVKNAPEDVFITTTKESIHGGKKFEGAIIDSNPDRVVLITKDLEMIEIKRADVEKQVTDWENYKNLVVKIAANKGKRSAIRVVTDRYGVKRRIDYKKSNIIYEPNYITRILTPEAREYLGNHQSFLKKLSEDIIDNGYDPEFASLTDVSREVKVEKMAEKLLELNSFQFQKGVFGQQFGRVVDLPPVFTFGADGKYITIDPIKSKYSDGRHGYNVKKGDTVVDVAGKEHTVSKVVDVYERDFGKVLKRYQSMIANIVPTYKYTGRGGAKNPDFKLKYITSIRAVHGDEIANWTEKAFELQINGQMRGPMANIFNKATAFTAAIGLSSPLSGTKNILLGQTNIVAGFGLRHSLAGYHKLLTGGGGRAWLDIVRAIGGTDVGVHELLTTSYSKYSPGAMYPTEIANRVTATVISDVILRASVDAILGRKTPLSRRISPAKASDFIKQTFKLDPGKIIKRGYTTRAEQAQAMQMGHLITQGGPSMPFVPPWMQKQFAKPLTLFYRIAYRVTEHVANNVMRPLIVRGNPMPMMRYVGATTLTGGALFGLYYNIMDKDTVNRFRGMPYQFWMQFIRGEGLAVLSNGFDQYGNVVDSYQPVVARTYSSMAKNVAYIIAGKKGAVEGTKDWFNENVVLWNHSRQVYERFAKPYHKAYTNSKRRQRHFLEATFGTGWMANYEPEDDFLTTRTPYYRHLRDVFWGENQREKARVYYAALEYITHDIERQRASAGKSVRGSRAEAKARLKGIISRRRPIPATWRKRKKGEKATMYKMYIGALTPEEQAEEREIERVYRQRRSEMRKAISTYRKEYDFYLKK
jgi:hypothetical protein